MVLTEGDMKEIISQSISKSAEPIALTMGLFGKLGDRVTVTGDVLRKGLADSGIAVTGPTSMLIESVRSIEKNGNTIAVTNDQDLSVKINGEGVRVKATVTLTFITGGDSLAISNITGVAVHKLLWFDVKQVQLSGNQTHKIIHIVTSGGSREFPLG